MNRRKCGVVTESLRSLYGVARLQPPSRRLSSTLPLIKIRKGTFYREYPVDPPSQSNPLLFPGLDFTLPASRPSAVSTQTWSIISSHSHPRTLFLLVLSSRLLCLPPTARTYPALSVPPSTAIHYIGFDADRSGPSSTATRTSYLSARYESRTEATDWTLRAWLVGDTILNPTSDPLRPRTDPELFRRRVADLRLENLLDMPVGNLSNGQTRRARIAKALLQEPKLVLLDGPFMGLDPPSAKSLSDMLNRLVQRGETQLVLSLKEGEEVPSWITNLVFLEGTGPPRIMGTKEAVLAKIAERRLESERQVNTARRSVDGFPERFEERRLGDKVVEMKNVRIAYGDKPVLGAWQDGLNFTLRQGQRLAVLGANGSGKTTLLSLITSDHPQSYAQDVKIFGRSRLPDAGQRGISLFELQRRIGHASPEVHSFFPKPLSVRRSLQSAWADAPLSRPEIGDVEAARVEAVLRHFADELDPSGGGGGGTRHHRGGERSSSREIAWADETSFAGLSFSGQRLLLFLRALVAGQEIVVLDEVFSGMDKEVRDKAFRFLATGAEGFPGLGGGQALIVIAHDKGDVPGCVRDWICLPEPAGEDQEQVPPRTGELLGPLELKPEAWGEIWGVTA